MAKLLSEDEEVKTSLEFIFLRNELKNKPLLSWVGYKLVIQSTDKVLTFEKEKKNNGAGDYVFALEPIDEVETITNGIKNFIKAPDKQMFSFEPVEPSFELILERSYRGYSVTCWIDAGNVISDHYTWDGFGVRFFTNEKNIVSFINELNKEKKDLFLKEVN